MRASPIASRPRLNSGPHPYSLSFVASPTPDISWRVPVVGAGNLRLPIRQKTMKPGPLDRRLSRRKQPRLEKLHFPRGLRLQAHLETPGGGRSCQPSQKHSPKTGNCLRPDGLEHHSPRVPYPPPPGFAFVVCKVRGGGWGAGVRCSDRHTYSFSEKLGVQEVLRLPSLLLWRHLEPKTPTWSDLLVTECHRRRMGRSWVPMKTSGAAQE